MSELMMKLFETVNFDRKIQTGMKYIKEHIEKHIEKHCMFFGSRGRILCSCLAAIFVMVLAGCGSAGNAPQVQEASVGIQTPVINTKPIVRVGSLKGPTTMGLLFLQQANEKGQSVQKYDFLTAVSAEELLPSMIKGDLDIALVPANVAAILYRKSEGSVTAIDINTMGVLYLVGADPEVRTLEDLKGKEICLTGKGTSPDYVLQYLLSKTQLSQEDVKLEYKSEASEVAAYLVQKPETIGFLPQPFATAVCIQNENLRVICSATEEWIERCRLEGSASGEYGPVTGVTVVRKAFLEEHPEAVETFLKEHAQSAASINSDTETGAKYCVEAGILANEAIAKKAIPNCSITCMTGEEMKEALEYYLEVLYEYGKETVGGALPGEDFYYCP